MFQYEDFYKLYNCKSEAKYGEMKQQLAEMMRQMVTTKERGFREKMFWFVKAQGEYLLMLTKLEEKWTPEYYRAASLAELKQDHDKLFGDLKAENYAKSYANPSYTAGLFGKELGPILAAYAKLFKDAAADAYCHRRFRLCEIIGFYMEIQKRLLMRGPIRADQLSSLLKKYALEQLPIQTEIRFHKVYNVSDAAWSDLILTEDLQQPYYLYQLGLPVSEQEEKLQQFFAALPQEEIEQMARATAEGFRKGFARDNKEMRRKSTAALYYPMGMERMVKRLIEILTGEMDLEVFVAQIESAGVNRQYDYDHRFDNALYLDEAYCQKYKACMTQLAEENEALLRGYGGPIVIESFGEKPFEPILKEECLSLSPEQAEWLEDMAQHSEQERYRTGKLEESSYTMIAFPVPAIGEKFEEIFHEIVKINCGQEHLAKAQHALIGTLDRGVAVRVHGRGENETDLTVALQPIQNPRRQTNFYNCTADFNIPAGEVYTTPQLAGTNGVLHVKKAYLEGLCYENLKVTFENGYITEYSCDNFENAEQGKRYIYENLLHPHDSLPMGEFAIGTNTQALCVAKKYDIMDVLPILIVEKLGPHFAIGDTCFSYEEDLAVFNPIDHKEITAKDNERSILRMTEPEKAYLQKHIDISLPLDEVGRMSVVKSSGDEIDLIREGRFVLIGTDILNAPIMAMENQLEGDLYVTNL